MTSIESLYCLIKFNKNKKNNASITLARLIERNGNALGTRLE